MLSLCFADVVRRLGWLPSGKRRRKKRQADLTAGNVWRGRDKEAMNHKGKRLIERAVQENRAPKSKKHEKTNSGEKT